MLFGSFLVEEQMEQIQLPLHEAARRGNLEFLRECLREGVSGTGLDATGNTPLYWAARAGHLSCVNELLSLPSPPVNVQVLDVLQIPFLNIKMEIVCFDDFILLL